MGHYVVEYVKAGPVQPHKDFPPSERTTDANRVPDIVADHLCQSLMSYHKTEI